MNIFFTIFRIQPGIVEQSAIRRQDQNGQLHDAGDDHGLFVDGGDGQTGTGTGRNHYAEEFRLA